MRTPSPLASLLALPLALLPLAAQDDAPNDAPNAATAQWEVAVVDEDGEPVFDADLWLRRTPDDPERAVGDGVPLQSLRTDPDGLVAFEVAAGVAHRGVLQVIGVSRPLELAFEALDAGEFGSKEVALTIHADTTYSGVAIAAENGAPLAEVDVLVASTLGQIGYLGGGEPRARSVKSGTRRVGATDECGAFAFDERSWRTTAVRLVHPDRSPVIVPFAHDDRDLTPQGPIAMKRAARLEGVLTFVDLDASVREAALVEIAYDAAAIVDPLAALRGAEPRRFAPNDSLGVHVRPEADGRFEVGGLPADTLLTVRVWSGRDRLLTLERTLRIAPGETERLDLVVDPGRTLSGLVVDPVGVPEEGVPVWLLPPGPGDEAYGLLRAFDGELTLDRTRTDANGRFLFEGVAPGAVRVAIGTEERRDPAAAFARRVQVGATDPEPTVLVAHRDLFVSGRVLGPDGEAFTDPTRVVLMSARGVVQETTSDGTFRLGPLLPGEWSLYAEPRGNAPTTRLLAKSDARKVRSGASDLVVEFAAGSAVELLPVDGTALTDTPVDAEVDLRHVGAGAQRRTTRASAPTAAFTSLRPGPCIATATTSDGRVGLVALDLEPGVDAGRVEVPVVPGGTLELAHAFDAEYTVIELDHDGRTIAIDGLIRDRIASHLLPPGPVEVRAFAATDAERATPIASAAGTIVPGETLRFVLADD